MEIIQGEKFQTLAGGNIYYCHTHNVNAFLQTNIFDKPFILISHNSDGKIIDRNCIYPHANFDLAPKTLVKWFAQNICIKNEKMESLPIGLENSYIKDSSKKIDFIIKKNEEKKNIKNLAYLNFNIYTNPEERINVWKKFNEKKFVTVETSVGYKKYLTNIYEHMFVFCPEGNGTDTHRTWESLYCGSIPIEKRNKNNIYFKDLPICFVDDWEEITENFLLKEYERISKLKWNLKKLDFNYWKNEILKLSNQIQY